MAAGDDENPNRIHGIIELVISSLNISFYTEVDKEGEDSKHMLELFGRVIITICAIFVMCIVRIFEIINRD